MGAVVAALVIASSLALTYAAWRRYLWALETPPDEQEDRSPYSLTDRFGHDHLINTPHQRGALWLSEIFSRSAEKYPHHIALQIPHSGESLTFSELDARARVVAVALGSILTGPDQVVAVAMSQDNWQIAAAHLGILKAGGTLMFLDTSLPDALIDHMLEDARPAVILTRGPASFGKWPTLDVLRLPETTLERTLLPTWLDDPAQRLAAIFYTSGTTGMPKGVECPHAGYVNLALSYADYFDLLPGMDATSLTSSLGYDGSISEMYSAWVSGCAVVMLTREQVRSGPDLVPILREAEVTMFFCAPVLLSTLTQSPERDLPYPLCRYIVPAGEAFPSALVEPWTRGRRQIINTYGPTEASTDTSRQSLRPGEPITIGTPFANVTYVILEPGQLEPLPHGEVGELCIGGVHVARGYRNLPEQTEERFIVHPEFGRLYRTGDRCRIDLHRQRVHFLGRIDNELKVRGHRVDTQAVEDMLHTLFHEIEAAILDYQSNSLVAFVAAPSLHAGTISGAVPAPPEWTERVTSALARRLPGPSVPSKIYLVDRFVMKPVSGKIDRKRLPQLSGLSANAEPALMESREDSAIRERDADAEMDPGRAEVLAICRSVFEMPLGLDDDFAEAGGHSITIARLAQKLQAAGRAVSVRALLTDCNTARKIADQAQAIQSAPAIPEPATTDEADRPQRDEPAAEVLSIGRFTTLQIAFLICLYFPTVAALLLFVDRVDPPEFFATASLWGFIAVESLWYSLILIVPVGNLLWVMLLKSYLGGHHRRNNVTPGVYPKWSRMHLRIWCIGRMEHAVLLPIRVMYRSPALMAFMLRQLGASVGANVQCAQDAELPGPLDLLSIGDDVSISTAAYIQTSAWAGGKLHVGFVRLENGCKIEMRAGIAPDVTVGRGAWVLPFTPVRANVGRHEMWEGAPARMSGLCTEIGRTTTACRRDDYPAWLLESLIFFMQMILSFWLTVVPTATILWLLRDMVPADGELSSAYFLVTPLPEIVLRLALYAFVANWITTVATSLLACLFIRWTAAMPGLYPARGLKCALLLLRMGLLNRVQRRWTWTLTGQYLRALAGMRFRRVGASECDLMTNLVPEAASADSSVFFSNGSFTNMLDQGAGYFKLRRLGMPRNFFSGNNCVAEFGSFPSNFTLGVSTPGSEIDFRRQMLSRPGAPIAVAGNPPVKFASAFSEQDVAALARPGFSIFLARILLFDVFSIGLLRSAEMLLFALLYVSFLRLGESPVIAVAMIALALVQVGLVLLSIAIKRGLIGREWGADHATPFWSWRHFAYFFAQDCFFEWCRRPLTFLAGTVLANPILRGMGCHIGHRTIVTQPMQCADWNAISFGNDCVVDGYLQFHTFENKMLKVKRTTIEDGSTIAFGATLMGGVRLGRNVNLLPLSLALKEMVLPTGVYEGSPVEAVPTLRAGVDTAGGSVRKPRPVNSADWLKSMAILFTAIGHFGYFFIAEEQWWSVVGRLAAPSFFFFMGYAKTRAIPLHWIALAIVLTLLESANAGWHWVVPNIFLSFVLIRLARPWVEAGVRHSPAATGLVMLLLLLAAAPMAGRIVDYGVEGWLWALFGLYQRMYVDSRSTAARRPAEVGAPPATTVDPGLMRLLVCAVTAAVYVWREQLEFAFFPLALGVVTLGVGLWSLRLLLFRRGPSRVQPPEPLAAALRFAGRHTLELYAIPLVCFEIIVMLAPDLAR